MNTNFKPAVQESIEETFGRAAYDIQLEADRKSYDIKDDVLHAFGKIKETSK